MSLVGIRIVSLLSCMPIIGLIAMLGSIPAIAQDDDKNQALIRAVVEGDLHRIASFLDSGANPDSRDRNGETALMKAVFWARRTGNLPLNRWGRNSAAHDQGGSPKAPAFVVATPLDEARLLLQKGADVNGRGQDGLTPLMVASRQGSFDMVQLLLAHGADVHARNIDFWTPIMFAAENGFADVVSLLVEKGADVDAQTRDGWTSLMMAARKGNQHVVELLLDKGADVNVENRDGDNALTQATSLNHMDIARILLDRGATATLATAIALRDQGRVLRLLDGSVDVDARDSAGRTPLMRASGTGQQEIVRLLLNRGAEVDAQDTAGETALVLAIRGSEPPKARPFRRWRAHLRERDRSASGTSVQSDGSSRQDVLTLLLSKGADVNLRTDNGETPLIVAARLGDPGVIRLLLDKGADVNLRSRYGVTALTQAVESEHSEAARLLLEHGADVNAKERSRRAVLTYAQDLGRTDIAELLMAHGAKP